ncbi:hypothetical protein [Sinosporangium siamense]|uniref:Uncharacterized protein n=1 Tax=Sinosporangium siamense TaxID=1367973 RepID=A0A919RPF4_9ACTN|nr:hypothetical protein [Sinosporangium siamense]GII97438.1 hypothetical protein Ssi02_76690 [Sinosporangium siamense]
MSAENQKKPAKATGKSKKAAMKAARENKQAKREAERDDMPMGQMGPMEQQ